LLEAFLKVSALTIGALILASISWHGALATPAGSQLTAPPSAIVLAQAKKKPAEKESCYMSCMKKTNNASQRCTARCAGK